MTAVTDAEAISFAGSAGEYTVSVVDLTSGPLAGHQAHRRPGTG